MSLLTVVLRDVERTLRLEGNLSGAELIKALGDESLRHDTQRRRRGK